jgi:predicted DNA-binding transcriptional regulator YafY
MPQVKQPHLRFSVIDEMLFYRPGEKIKYCTLLDFMKEMQKRDLKVSIRTLERDINTLRKNTQLNYDAPIEHCDKTPGYYYSKPGYSIRNTAITQDQLQLLTIASGLLQRFQGMGKFSELEGVVTELEKTLTKANTSQSKSTNSFILLEEAAHLEGLQHMERLVMAIWDKQPLKILYNAFGKENKEHQFHPYFLKQHKQRWYLIGSPENKDVIYPLALDRIRKIEDLIVYYKPCPVSNPDEYYQNIIGISYPESTPEKIILSFTPTQGNYIKTQYLHKSQQILVDNEQELRVALHVFPNYELISTLMGYGPDVKVLEPQSLREKLRELYRKGLEGYSD